MWQRRNSAAGAFPSRRRSGLFGVRFVGKRLPCYERYLFGLFAALRGVVVTDTSFGLVYAHDPEHRVLLSYEWRVPSRDVWDR